MSELYARLSATQRLASLGGIAALLAIGISLFALYGPGHKAEYSVLFANVSAEDAASITQKLKDDKVPYVLADGGATIKVPQESVYEERVQLAGSGTIKGGGTGYELFDRTNLGMTDFQEKVAKTRAIEGELQRTIAGLSAVQSARVHIATPDQTLYSSTQQPTTASVTLKTKAGSSLDATQVAGITSLVSHSVEGLKDANVTIIDQNGNVLKPKAVAGTTQAEVQASALQMTEQQLLFKQRYEENVQQSIQGLLDKTLGPNRSAARVAADMNFDANSNETKSFAPQGTVRSEQVERESYRGQTPGRPPAQGVPGTTTNVVGTYQGQQQGQNGTYNKNKSTKNYEITESNVKHVDAPGKATRLSVAVLVNVPANTTAQPNGTFAVAAADVTKIRNVVRAAAGIDETRGDQISVEAIPFNPAVTGEPARVATATTVFGVPLSVLIALGAILLLAGIGAGVYAMRRGRAFQPVGDEMPTFDSTLAEELPPFQEHPMLDAAPGLAAPIRSAADMTREQMIEYVTTVAQENPDSIAKLIKLWLAE